MKKKKNYVKMSECGECYMGNWLEAPAKGPGGMYPKSHAIPAAAEVEDLTYGDSRRRQVFGRCFQQ
jgi:hypothetical protein